MEGGAFIEWDFLRGIREGWFPKIQPPNSYSENAYGSCEEIFDQTKDDIGIIHPFPECGNDTYWDPEGFAWQFDYEQQHGGLNSTDSTAVNKNDGITVIINGSDNKFDRTLIIALYLIGASIAIMFCWRRWHVSRPRRNRKEYTEVIDSDTVAGGEKFVLI